MQRKVTTLFQQFWLSKLMGLDYEVIYKSGKDNVVADALSRVQGAEILCLALSVVSSDLSSLIQASYLLDNTLVTIIEQLQHHASVGQYSMHDALLRKKGKLLVGTDQNIIMKIISWLHSSPEGGHSGRDITTKKFKSFFVWRVLLRM